MKFLRKIYLRYFPKYRRLEARFVSYADGDRLIRESAGKTEPERWQIAPEEDRNQVYGYVHLERRERVTA